MYIFIVLPVIVQILLPSSKYTYTRRVLSGHLSHNISTQQMQAANSGQCYCWLTRSLCHGWLTRSLCHGWLLLSGFTSPVCSVYINYRKSMHFARLCFDIILISVLQGGTKKSLHLFDCIYDNQFMSH